VSSDRPLQDRRTILWKGSACLVSLALSLITWGNAARAAKADKAALHYQDRPRNGKSCADCWAYAPVPGAGKGSCKAVEGPVRPNGWCMAYSPKQTSNRTSTKPIAA